MSFALPHISLMHAFEELSKAKLSRKVLMEAICEGRIPVRSSSSSSYDLLPAIFGLDPSKDESYIYIDPELLDDPRGHITPEEIAAASEEARRLDHAPYYFLSKTSNTLRCYIPPRDPGVVNESRVPSSAFMAEAQIVGNTAFVDTVESVRSECAYIIKREEMHECCVPSAQFGKLLKQKPSLGKWGPIRGRPQLAYDEGCDLEFIEWHETHAGLSPRKKAEAYRRIAIARGFEPSTDERHRKEKERIEHLFPASGATSKTAKK